MNNLLQFDFNVDKENKTISVKREFAAAPAKVWAAWTKSELLDQWWAPKPWRAETKSMDFSVGGTWLYAMVGPNDERHYSRVDFKSIEQQKNFSARAAFCDENGVEAGSSSSWNNKFNNKGDGTLVDIFISFERPEDFNMMIEMGFQGGFTMGLQNLDELLAL